VHFLKLFWQGQGIAAPLYAGLWNVPKEPVLTKIALDFDPLPFINSALTAEFM
jgi:hypothetical protein